jgi:hypothetical protein
MNQLFAVALLIGALCSLLVGCWVFPTIRRAHSLSCAIAVFIMSAGQAIDLTVWSLKLFGAIS